MIDDFLESADLQDAERESVRDVDEQHMHKVVGYVHRHGKQRPSGDVTDTRWRYSLTNWGRDPLED